MKEFIVYAGLFILAIISILFIIKIIIKKGYILLNGILGAVALFIINSLNDITGIYLGYDIITVVFSVFLGCPGVIFLVIEKFI